MICVDTVVSTDDKSNCTVAEVADRRQKTPRILNSLEWIAWGGLDHNFLIETAELHMSRLV